MAVNYCSLHNLDPSTCLTQTHSCVLFSTLLFPQTKYHNLSPKPRSLFKMTPSAPSQRFSFDEKLSHIRSRGIDIHPHLPDNCPKGSDGLPIFGSSIDHLLPNHDDACRILQFFGLKQITTDQILALYAQDSEPHIDHGEAVFDGKEYSFPLAQQLFELYAARRLTIGSYEQSYGIFITPHYS